MAVVLTLSHINAAIRNDYSHRMHVDRDQHDLKLQREMQAWCRERFGASAIGNADNRDEPGFYKLAGQRFVDPSVARFEYNPTRAWVYRYFCFHFHDLNHAFEFKMRWL